MRKLVKQRSTKRGQPPGTLHHVGEIRPDGAGVTVFDYDEGSCSERTVEGPEACRALRDSPTVSWINVDGLHDVERVRGLGEAFGLHPLVMEDIVNTDQRPKLEEFEGYLYLAAKMLRWDRDQDELTIEQVSLVLGPKFVLSFQERPGDVFGPIRDRLRSAKGRIRRMGPDYLAYALLDAIVDGYFDVLEHLGDRIEHLEERLLSRPEPGVLHQLHRLKREALFIRKSVWPLREVVSGLQRTESELIGGPIEPYLRDLHDHTVQVIDTTETLRDLLGGMLETYLSSVSNRMNEVMKVLTIIATIFIPLTFIAGVYGMNFKDMPELGWHWAYPAVWLLMLLVAAGMVIYFRRRRWL